MKISGAQKGFSLIELAIVITISGILFSSFLQLYSQLQEKQRIETTKARMEALQAALTGYAVTHDRLPCPASPDASRTSSDDVSCAVDAKPPPGVVAATVGTNVMDAGPEQQVWIGIMPTRALRLSGDMRRDSWGNDFTYAVSRRLTLPKGMLGNPVPTGIISVVDQNGDSVLDKPGTGRYVIISHGPSGDGGWNGQEGVRARCPSGTLAAANCKDNGIFVVAPYSRAPGPSFYDHFLVFDGPDAGGSLVSRIAACNLKKAFYVPTAPDADKGGCVREIGVWHGACVQSTKFDKNGHPQPQPPVVLMPPATASGANCACAPTYQSVRINSWSDTGEAAFVVALDAAGMVLTADKSGKVTGTVTSLNSLSTNTALYTCVQPPN